MSSHVMVDLETLDTRSSAVILSIGACLMDPITGQMSESFYRSVQTTSCVDVGLSISTETLKWWSEQSEEARAVLTDPAAIPLIQMLADFSNYLRMLPGGDSKAKIWGNGSDFDNVILANAYRALGFEAPWRFYNNRCFRTVKNTMKHLGVKEPTRGGTYHNALDDALWQAEYLLSMKDHISWT